jgi:hypothetical protein
LKLRRWSSPWRDGLEGPYNDDNGAALSMSDRDRRRIVRGDHVDAPRMAMPEPPLGCGYCTVLQLRRNCLRIEAVAATGRWTVWKLKSWLSPLTLSRSILGRWFKTIYCSHINACEPHTSLSTLRNSPLPSCFITCWYINVQCNA